MEYEEEIVSVIGAGEEESCGEDSRRAKDND